jgi:Tfp pilus assembly protein PilE
MRRSGLTLIEVLIIIVMIGILLTITIQKIGKRKLKSQIESLKADLESVRTAESRYFAAHASYGTRLQLDSTSAVAPGQGNTLTITTTSAGYTAVASNTGTAAGTLSCTLRVEGGEVAAQQAVPDCQ